jgi:Ankyrin repeats (3 copies)
MSDRKLVIMSVIFVAVIVLAAGGRFAWVTYQDWVEDNPQTHFMLAVDAMDAYDPNRLGILLDKYPHLTSTHLNADGTTLLHRAMLNGGDLTLASMLLSEGADVSATDTTGRTPLHALCTHEDGSISPDVVALLASSGADMNALDDAGETPLDLMVFVPDVYSAAFPEYVINTSKENRDLLIGHGAVE